MVAISPPQPSGFGVKWPQLRCQALLHTSSGGTDMRNRTRYGAVCILAVFLALVLGSRPLGAQAGKIEVLWLGQSATRITTVSGKGVGIDPSLTPHTTMPAHAPHNTQ